MSDSEIRLIKPGEDTEDLSMFKRSRGSLVMVYAFDNVSIAGDYQAEECFYSLQKLECEGAQKYIMSATENPRMAYAMGVEAVPALLFIDETGVVWRSIGIATVEQWQATINTKGVSPC